MRRLMLCAVTLTFLSGVPTGFAQAHSADCLQDRVKCAYESAIRGLAAEKEATKKEDRLGELMDPVRVPDRFVLALTGQSFPDTLLVNAIDALQQARVDKQIGSNSSSNGSTNLVSRPSTSELLGLGVQAGAFTQTVSGSVATFQANAGGAYRAIIGQPIICQDCLPKWSLNNLNVFVSFDLNSQGAQTLNTSGSANASPAPSAVVVPVSSRQFSSLIARYNLKNPVDPRSESFKKAWTASYDKHADDLKKASDDLNHALVAILEPLSQDADGRIKKLQDSCPAGTTTACGYTKRISDDAEKATDTTGFDNLVKVFKEYFSQLADIARADVPDLDKKVKTAIAAFARYSQLNYDTVLEARGSQFTFEYTYNRPQGQPDTHDFRLIVGLNPKQATSGSLFTLNFAGTIYGGQIPAGSQYGRLRDFQLAAQFDRPLGELINHATTLTLAGYAQYQFDPSVLNIGPGNLVPGTNITLPQNAQVLLGTKGILGIVQGKITLNMKSGVNIPIGVSWASRTDLLNATDVQGHIGITYDFNSITQLLGR